MPAEKYKSRMSFRVFVKREVLADGLDAASQLALGETKARLLQVAGVYDVELETIFVGEPADVV